MAARARSKSVSALSRHQQKSDTQDKVAKDMMEELLRNRGFQEYLVDTVVQKILAVVDAEIPQKRHRKAELPQHLLVESVTKTSRALSVQISTLIVNFMYSRGFFS